MTCWYGLDGEKLCPIASMEDRQAIDGTIRILLPEEDAGLIPRGGGLFEVHSEESDAVYLAQALSCVQASEGLLLSCTPLGACITAVDEREGDNYLVLDGEAPILIRNLIEARSNCPRGDHVRIDVDNALWDTVNVSFGNHIDCNCGGMGCSCNDNENDRTWDFRQLMRDSQIVTADLIMLSPRQRTRLTLDVGRRGPTCTTLICHARLRYDLAGKPLNARHQQDPQQEKDTPSH